MITPDSEMDGSFRVENALMPDYLINGSSEQTPQQDVNEDDLNIFQDVTPSDGGIEASVQSFQPGNPSGLFRILRFN